MTITTPTVSDALRRIEPSMRAAIDRLDAGTRHACGYHLGYWDADGNPASPGGKGIRPALALLSAKAAGAGDEIGIPAAVACELVHNFSLLHDDVIDRDEQRRHRTTAWAQFGVPTAILAGDALAALACEVVAEAPSPTVSWAVRCLTSTTRRLIAGQGADLEFETREHVSVAECQKMADDKTGALMACAASLGAILADADSELALGLAEYGVHLGRAFQYTDDILGIWGEPDRTGKPVLSDLRSRKKTLPVVYALDSGTDAAGRLAELYSRPQLSEAELAESAELVAASGGRDWAQRRVDEELEAALTKVRSLGIAEGIADEFAELAHGLSGRDH